MQNLTLPQTLEAVNTLNNPEQPFSFHVQDETIIGEWKYLDAIWAAPLSAGTIDNKYQIKISFDVNKREYSIQENENKKTTGISFNPLSGSIKFGGKTSSFKGRMIGGSSGFGIGSASQEQNQTSVGGPTYQWKFKTSEIKEPLLNFLNQCGWQKKKSGLFSRLFG